MAIESIHNILDIFHTHFYLENLSYTNFQILYYIVFSSICVVILLTVFLYLGIIFKKSYPKICITISGLSLFLISNFLYLPLLSLSIIPLECTEENNSDVMTFYPSVKCWNNEAIPLQATSTILIVFLIGISAISCVMLGQTLKNQSNSKYSIKKDVIFVSVKTILVLFTVWVFNKANLILLLVCIFCYGMMLYQHLSRQIYINNNLDIFSQTFVITNLYLFIFISCAEIFSQSNIFLASFITLPFAICISLSTKKYYTQNNTQEILLKNLLVECRYLLALSQDISNRSSRTILFGKLSQHSLYCLNPNCEMHKDNFKKSIVHYNELDNPQTHQAFMDLVKSFCRRRFLYYKTQHGESVQLSLDCCLFYVEEIKNPILALSELKNIESFDLTFYEAFLLHRYTKLVKKFCDDQISESREFERQQLRSINLQSSVKKFEELLKQVTNKYIGFWCALEEETPEYSFLKKTLIILNQMYEEMEEQFEELREAQSYRTLKLYGHFLFHIMKEEKLGAKLLKDAEELSHIRNTNEDLLGGVSMAELKHITNETPVIVVSGSEKRLGIILDCNSALMRLFGYAKEELLSNNISMLIPEPYNSIHEKLMILKKNEGNVIDKPIFGLHRNRYIFKGTLRIVRYANILNSFTYIAIINPISDSSSASLLLSRDLRIIALSSQCISMLELSYFQIRQNEANLRTLCPELKSRSLKEISNNSINIEYFFPLKRKTEDIRSEDDDNLDNFDSNELVVNSRRSCIFSFRMESISVGSQLIGFWASFLKIRGEIGVESKRMSIIAVKAPPDFRFLFDPDSNNFLRNVKQSGGSDTSKGSYHSIKTGSLNTFFDLERVIGHTDSTIRKKAISGFYCFQKKRIESLFRGRDIRIRADVSDLFEYIENQIQIKPDYSIGVKTYRLLNGDQIDISNQSTQQLGILEEDFSNTTGKTSRSSTKKSQSVSNLLSSIKSKKFLMRLIKGISMPITIKIMLVVCLLVLSLNIGLSLFITQKFSDNYETVDNNNLISFNTLQKNTVIIILYLHIHELFLIKSGAFTNSLLYFNKKTSAYIAFLYSKLISEAAMVSYYLNLLINLMSLLNHGDEIKTKISNQYVTGLWPSEMDPNTTIPKQIPYLSFHYIVGSSLYTLMNKTFSELQENGSEEMFLEKNIMNVLYQATNEIDQDLRKKIVQEFSLSSSTTITSLTIFALISVISIPILYIIMKKIALSYQRMIIGVFLDLPFKHVRKQMEACQNFISFTQIDAHEEDTVSANNDHQDFLYIARQQTDEFDVAKKRQFSGMPKTSKLDFLISFLFIAPCVIYYIVVNIVFQSSFVNQFKTISFAYNDCLDSNEISLLALTVQKSYFENPKGTMMGFPLNQFSIETYLRVIESSSALGKAYLILKNKISAISYSQIEEIYKGDLCVLYPFPTSQKFNCNTFHNGLMRKGISSLLVLYGELLRANIEKMMQNNQTAPAGCFNDDTFNIPTIIYRDFILKGTYFIGKIMRSAMIDLVNELKIERSKYNIAFCFWLAIFAIFLCLITLFISFKSVQMRSTLALLPISLVKKSGRFKNYLEHNVSSEELLISQIQKMSSSS